MTRTIEIIPSQAVRSEYNERQEDVDKESEEFQNIVRTVENGGISNKPVARMEDGQYAIVDGWNRVKAAEEAGFEKIEINIEEMTDVEAMKKSLYGNMDDTRVPVDPRDRALHLLHLWERIREGDPDIPDDATPSASRLAEEIGPSRVSIQRMLDPLQDEWKDTLVDPTSEKQHVHSEHLKNFSERKIASIRKTTGGGGEGEWLIKKTVEEGLTIQDLAQVRRHVNDGASVENAVGLVTGDLSLDDVGLTEEEEPEETEEAADPEPQEEESPAESPDTTSTAETSTAELSQGTTSSWSSSGDGETATTSTTETPSPETETEETDEEDVEVDEGLPERYQGRDLVASEEQIEKMQEMQEEENGSFASTLEAVDEEAAEDGPTVEVEGFELHGRMAEAAMETFEQDMFEDGQDLARFAVEKMLREGNWA